MDRTGIGLLLVCLLCGSTSVLGQDMVNIAPGKSYDQSSTYDSTFLSRYATDGDTNSIPYFNSKTDINPYWEVDLGRTYPVHSIILWSYSSVSSGGSMYPVNVTVDGQHCVTVSSNPTSFRNNSVTCSSALHGRRLRVTGTGTGSRQLALCEIEILVPTGGSRCDEGRWGSRCQYHCTNNCGETTSPNFCYESTLNCYDECVAGRWGDRCQNRCGQNCATGDCGLKTGNCSACLPGWYGDQCNTRCPSHSCLLNTCHQMTGRCLACHTGYDGDTCTGVSEGEAEKLTGPVVGAITGVGLLLVVSLLVFLCWKQRSQKTVHETDKTTTSVSDPVGAHNYENTAPSAVPSPSPLSAEPQADTQHEIRDPGNTYQPLRIYSNMVFERELPVAPESRADDVTATSGHADISLDNIYVNSTTTTSKNVNPRSNSL